MLRSAISLLLCFLFFAAPVAAQEVPNSPVGEYDVQGWSPGEFGGPSTYSGDATIWANGDSFLFEAEMDGERYTGVALLDPKKNVLAIQFNGTDGFGLTLLRLVDDHMEGPWVFGESPKRAGYEIWTRRP